MERRGLVRQTGRLQAALEFHQVVGNQRSLLIFFDLGIVRVGLELAGLVTDHRNGNALERIGEITHRTGMEMIQDAAVHHVGE